ncbi:hypothetical protein CMI39_02990 [Candidatus Pacearchaeota archaeon]|jgi:hypothetical protein|nr:hypothetical protein [Candidatus Pacearchaeota archaeon]|tara:strand:- start:766 stop:1065 length:300 start_codon:yes stop_codon:yes gene_type:complete
MKISVKEMDYEDAERIIDKYSENRIYMFSLIQNYIPKGQRPEMDLKNNSTQQYRTMLNHSRAIKGIAKKILKSKKETKLDHFVKIEKIIGKDSQLDLFR